MHCSAIPSTMQTPKKVIWGNFLRSPPNLPKYQPLGSMYENSVSALAQHTLGLTPAHGYPYHRAASVAGESTACLRSLQDGRLA